MTVATGTKHGVQSGENGGQVESDVRTAGFVNGSDQVGAVCGNRSPEKMKPLQVLPFISRCWFKLF